MKIFFTLLFNIALFHTSVGQNSSDKKLIKNVILAFQDDFNEGGFKNVEIYTTKDWEHINPGGGITKGRESVLKEVRVVHQTFLKGVSMTIESMTIRFLTRTVAITNVVHKMSEYELPQGIIHQNERQMKTYVTVKRQNKWFLTLDQNTVIVGH
jgi:uncharacterized protein (TIGR02246 family)